MSRPEPARSQSTTSLSRFYNSSAAPGGARPVGEEDLTDPRLDFCNSFWGVDGRGYDVVMARLRGAGRTIDELKAFWKERSVRFLPGSGSKRKVRWRGGEGGAAIHQGERLYQ